MVVAALSSESAKPDRVSSIAISIKLQSNAPVWVQNRDMKIRLAPVIPEVGETVDEVLLLFALVVGRAAVGRGRVLDDGVGTVQEGLEIISMTGARPPAHPFLEHAHHIQS